MIRVVIDTNVFLSYFLSSKGTVGKVISYVYQNGVILASNETLSELAAKLSVSRFATKYGTEGERIAFLDKIRQLVVFEEVTSIVRESPDPDDNIFLALAIDGRADYIISGDKKHLLVLGSYHGIPIYSPAQFLESLKPENETPSRC
jgi:putative PIN family toxin of toxin-antitoxin system